MVIYASLFVSVPINIMNKTVIDYYDVACTYSLVITMPKDDIKYSSSYSLRSVNLKSSSIRLGLDIKVNYR